MLSLTIVIQEIKSSEQGRLPSPEDILVDI